jgi:hypothetical protein
MGCNGKGKENARAKNDELFCSHEKHMDCSSFALSNRWTNSKGFNFLRCGVLLRNQKAIV